MYLQTNLNKIVSDSCISQSDKLVWYSLRLNTVLKGIDIREKSVKAEIDNMLVADVIKVRLHYLQAYLQLFFSR